ncbi:hypothetical protein [Halomonas salinarum]|uniref:hypothetical protein n=1 Tax=Halomonas salinarum TaxID=1158993 RepID=UPI00143B04B2|nr:hypothetical protein [Halomonas salinarum]
MPTQKQRHHTARRGATRRETPPVLPRHWLTRLNGWLTESRLNRLVDISVLTALIMAGLALLSALISP